MEYDPSLSVGGKGGKRKNFILNLEARKKEGRRKKGLLLSIYAGRERESISSINLLEMKKNIR